MKVGVSSCKLGGELDLPETQAPDNLSILPGLPLGHGTSQPSSHPSASFYGLFLQRTLVDTVSQATKGLRERARNSAHWLKYLYR